MIHELRTYVAMPGRLPDLHRRFREHTVPNWQRRGWDIAGFWTYKHGGRSDTLIYLLAWADQAARDAAWADFQADPAWQQARTESEVNGPLVAYITSEMLLPTDYSPQP